MARTLRSQRFGAHMSVADGLHRAFDAGVSVGIGGLTAKSTRDAK